MNSIYDKLMKCYDCFQKKINFTPEIALVLGSGLGNYASKIKIEATLDYHDIDGFPVSTVPGHQGRYIFGYVENVPVVCMQGFARYLDILRLNSFSSIIVLFSSPFIFKAIH